MAMAQPLKTGKERVRPAMGMAPASMKFDAAAQEPASTASDSPSRCEGLPSIRAENRKRKRRGERKWVCEIVDGEGRSVNE